MADRLSHLLDGVRPPQPRPASRGASEPWPEMALIFDVGRLSLLGALVEGTMGQILWGDVRGEENTAALYEFRNSRFKLHDVVRHGVLQRIDKSIEVESWDPFGRSAMRPWFVCPNEIEGEPCGRRANKLLLLDGEGQLKCRRCVGSRRKLREFQVTDGSAHRLVGVAPD